MLSSSGPSTNLSKPSFAACPTCRRRWISSAIFRTVHTSAGDHRHNRLRGHSLNFRLHMLSCAGATILSAFGGEVEKVLGDRRGFQLGEASQIIGAESQDWIAQFR
jgi:hypothetical protein